MMEKQELKEFKRNYTYNKFPIIFWKILCFLGIKHNWLLIESHNHDPKTKKRLKLNKWYFIYECVYCGRRKKE